MRKWLIRLLAGALAVGLCTASVYAAGGGRHSHGSGSLGTQLCAGGACRNDTDRDGLCDLCGLAAGSCAHGRAYQDADGDGICDAYTGSAGGRHGCHGGGGGCHSRG